MRLGDVLDEARRRTFVGRGAELSRFDDALVGRSARRVFLHIVAETTQHAGHADIIREAIDGQKTMG